jgi:hypothetical protein
MDQLKASVNNVTIPQLANTGLLGLLLFGFGELSDSYQSFNDNLIQNTRANQQLLELHQEWFAVARPNYQDDAQ